MLLHIVARGKIGRSPEGELVQRYVKRIAWPTLMTELPDEGGKLPPPRQNPARQVLLDERGPSLSSAELAQLLGQWRDLGVREVQFHIGAADGHPAEQRNGADMLLSFGSATWPHLMVRAMLTEQLYRAVSILAGHPYHRAG